MSFNDTSTTPRRKWIPCSHRWGEKMKALAHMKESEVMKVGGLTFVDDKKFMIIQTEKTEVLLGLRDDGTEVAIKRMRKSSFKEVLHELEVLLKHRFTSRHVVQYVDSAEDKYFGYIAMQLCECTLAEYISARQPAPSGSERKRIAKEFLKGLKDLHEANVIHRDIKPHNVLIDKDGRVRLADFGLSRMLDLDQTSKETGNAGTQCWVATEIIKNILAGKTSRYKRNTDIQVAGMLVYYILSGGKHPFGDPVHCHGNICDGKYTLQDLNDDEAKDLVENMLNVNPMERPRITEVLKHFYFWEEDRKEMFLREVGNVGEVEKYGDLSDDESLVKKMQGKTFSTWKTELKSVTDMDDMKKEWLSLVEKFAKDGTKFPQTLLCLLRFIRNRWVHSKDEMKEINVMKLFPDLLGTAYNCAKEREWEVKGFLPLSSSEKRKAESSIPTQVWGQEPGGQTQEMRTVTESSLMARPSRSGQTQEMRTVTESSLTDVARPSQSGQTQEMRTLSDSNLTDVDGPSPSGRSSSNTTVAPSVSHNQVHGNMNITTHIHASAPSRHPNPGQEFFSNHKGTLETRLPSALTSILIPLQKGRVLNDLEREQVESKSTRAERNYVLLTMIQNKGAIAQRLFYEVLKEADPVLMNDLEGTN
ncbi:serine/threonine-protein kinase/endoribonuclease IRE1-like isoform X2 [Sardina pilchardus]|uniref:serine/threonine-protein kinase/endoribonuclease IRE1-like isoform X2 n=1 Tax=Sardina pilchardus TaxID=27697 RepID=UPI002E101513